MEKLNKILEAPSNPSWLKTNTILLVEAGSYAYGTNTKDSDKDYKGVAIPPLEYHLGLHNFENFTSNSNNGKKNTADDVDVTIYSLKKFVKLGLNSNPHILEMLFVDEGSFVLKTDVGNQLIKHRDLFVSNKIMRSFGGFATSNRKRLVRDAEKKNLSLSSYDYDTKVFMHAVRIYQMAIELFRTGTMHTKRENAEYLLELRRGTMTYGEALEFLKELERGFRVARDVSVLPDKPNQKKIEQLLINLTMRQLNLQ